MDLALTLIGLHMGFTEGNGIAVWLMGKFGILGGLGLLKLFGIFWGFLMFYTKQLKPLIIMNALVLTIGVIPWLLVISEKLIYG
jgi:hypothetical protein